MLMYLIGFVLLGFGLGAVALQRLYSAVPLRELKRLATEGDGLAKALYGPAAYGSALRALLWSVASIGLAIGLLLLGRNLPALAGVGLMAVVLLAVLVWLPSLELGLTTARLAVLAARPTRWMLSHSFVFWEKVAHLANRRRQLRPHTHIYDKHDLRALLTRQQSQHDNRISKQELAHMDRVLAFHEKKAADITTPRQDIRLLASTELIGPILLGELHASGQQHFFVYEGTPENIVGVVRLQDAVAAREGGMIGELVRHDLCYVHEDFSLHRVLEALRETQQYLAVVVNSFEEIVGTLHFDRLVSELFGEQAAPESAMNYENRAQVSAFRVQPVAAEVAESDAQISNSNDVTTAEPATPKRQAQAAPDGQRASDTSAANASDQQTKAESTNLSRAETQRPAASHT